jgi:hypothetical protein
MKIFPPDPAWEPVTFQTFQTMKLFLLLFILIISSTLHAQLNPFYSSEKGKYGYRDASDKVVVKPVFELAYPFEEGMAAMRVAGKYGYLDESGKVVVAPKYDFTWRFIGGFAAVKLNGKFGFIDKTGREVIPPVYEEANNFHGGCCYKGMAHVKEQGKWKLITL